MRINNNWCYNRTYVSYSIKKITIEPVTVTITANKKIEEPAGWTYANHEQTAIKKVYEENTTETVEIRDLTGSVTSVQVKIENIGTLANEVINNE